MDRLTDTNLDFITIIETEEEEEKEEPEETKGK